MFIAAIVAPFQARGKIHPVQRTSTGPTAPLISTWALTTVLVGHLRRKQPEGLPHVPPPLAHNPHLLKPGQFLPLLLSFKSDCTFFFLENYRISGTDWLIQGRAAGCNQEQWSLYLGTHKVIHTPYCTAFSQRERKLLCGASSRLQVPINITS